MPIVYVFSYDGTTKEYLHGSEPAQMDPLEQDNLLVPANATTIEPPTFGEREIAVFDGAAEAWVVKPDYRYKIHGEIRGVEYYDTITQEKKIIEEIGTLPSISWTMDAPTDVEQLWNGEAWEVPFDILKERKKAEITAARYEAEIAGITVNGVYVATDDRSQNKIANATLQTLFNPAYTLNWKIDSDNSIELDATQLVAMATAVREYVQGCFDKEIELLAAANACTTEKTLNKIQW